MESGHHNTLLKRLTNVEFELIFDPPGDGMCFYAAAAYQLQMNTTTLRDVIFDYLQRNTFDVCIWYLSVKL